MQPHLVFLHLWHLSFLYLTLFLVIFSLVLVFLLPSNSFFSNVKCLTTHTHTHTCSEILEGQTSHLMTESALVVIVIADVATWFRFDECDITFPHECRRSGLNEGTIRKCRLDDNEIVEEGDSWSMPFSNDITIDWFCLLFFSLSFDVDVIRARDVWI